MKKTTAISAAIIVILIIAYFGASAYLKHRTVSYINDFALYAGIGSKVEYGKVNVNPITMNGLVKDISVTKDGLNIVADTLRFNAVSSKAAVEGIKIQGPLQSAEIERVDLNKYVLEDGVPKSTDIDITGFTTSIPSLAKNGQDNVSLNISIATEADFENQVYEYTKLNIEAPELMDLNMKLTVSGFDIKKYAAYSGLSADDLDGNEEFSGLVADDMGKISLNNMVINFKDKGIISRYYLSAAAEAGLSEEELAKELTNTLDGFIERTESDFDKRFAEDTKKFILGEYSEATFTIAPEEPVNIQTIAFSVMMGASSEQLIEILGFSYTAK